MMDVLAAKRADGKAAADDLAECGQIRRDAFNFLHAAAADAQRDNLVKQQEDIVARRQLPQPAQVTRRRRDHPARIGYRLDDERGDALMMFAQHGFGIAEIVERARP